MTKAVQEVTFGEGLAIGCLRHGVAAVTRSKLPLEFAFRRVWPSWQGSRQFPSVHATLARTDIWRLLLSHHRRKAWYATWVEDGGFLVPALRASWHLPDAAEALAEASGVAIEQWDDLARSFVAELKPEEFFRAG